MVKKPTKQERAYMDKVAQLGCLICQQPAEIHHLTGAGMGKRASNYDILPLCFNHHSAQSPLPFGHAVHKGTRSFEANYGTQKDLLKKLREVMNE